MQILIRNRQSTFIYENYVGYVLVYIHSDVRNIFINMKC